MKRRVRKLVFGDGVKSVKVSSLCDEKLGQRHGPLKAKTRVQIPRGANDICDGNLGFGKKKFVDAYGLLLKQHLAKLQHVELSEVILGDMPIRSVDDNKAYNTLKWTLEPGEE